MSSALLERICNFFLFDTQIFLTQQSCIMHTQNQQEKQTEICFKFDLNFKFYF